MGQPPKLNQTGGEDTPVRTRTKMCFQNILIAYTEPINHSYGFRRLCEKKEVAKADALSAKAEDEGGTVGCDEMALEGLGS